MTLTATSGVGSRWAGQYATLIDTAGNGLSPVGGPYQPDDQVLYLTCGEDAGQHPASTGYSTPQDAEALMVSIHGSIAHPEYLDAYLFSLAASADNRVDTVVPGGSSGIVYLADEWAAASYTLGKALVGDRSGGSGTVVVSNIVNPWSGTGSARVEALVAELLATAASNVTLDANFAGAPTATNANILIQQSGVRADGTAVFLTGVYGSAVQFSSVTNLVFPDGSAIPIGSDLYLLAFGGNPYVHYDAPSGLYQIEARPAGPGAISFEVTREIQDTAPGASWRATPNAGGGQQAGLLYWRPGNKQLADSDADVFLPYTYFYFQKRSADATISVAGGQFELRDANGAVLASWTSDGTGNQAIGPLDLTTAPRPLSFVEVAPPSGLGVAAPIVLDDSPPFPPFSSDPANPTVVTMTDAARNDVLVIQKLVAGGEVPADLSGYTFSVTRVADGLVPAGTPATTLPTGLTPQIVAPMGVYDVCEISRPPESEASTDSPGCLQLTLSGDGGSVEFPFTNTRIQPFGATMVSTDIVARGDQVIEYQWTRGLPAAGRLVDVTTTFYGVAGGGAPTCAAAEQVGSVLSKQVTLGAAETVTAQDPFTVPEVAGAWHYAAVTVVSDVATGLVYLTGSCDDMLEHFFVPEVSTVAPAVITGSTATDTYRLEGVPFDLVTVDSAAVSFAFHQVPVFSCDAPATPALQTVTTTVTASTTSGSSPAVNVPVLGAVYQFVETGIVTTTRTTTPDGGGWTVPIPGSTGTTTTTTTEIPGVGGCSETSPAPSGSTQVRDKVLVGQPLTDDLLTTGFGTADLTTLVWPSGPLAGQPIFSNVVANFTLHAHDPLTVLTDRTCSTSNQIASTSTPINGDGSVSVAIADYSAAAGKQTSFSEWYTGDRLNADGTITSWSTVPTGCQDVNETAIVPSWSTQVNTPFLNGVEDSTDDILLTGLGDGSVLQGWTVAIDGSMHNHLGNDSVSSWVCTDANEIAPIPSPIPAPADGLYTSGPITPGQYMAAHGGGTSYSEWLIITRPDGSTFNSPARGCQEPSETSWVPKITTQVSSQTAEPGQPLADLGIVSGVPAGTPVTILLGVYRVVPGNADGITTDNACYPPNDGKTWINTIEYTADGSGVFASPSYVVRADEVAGVIYVHQETLFIGGKRVTQERCGAAAEMTTIVPPHHSNLRLMRTS